MAPEESTGQGGEETVVSRVEAHLSHDAHMEAGIARGYLSLRRAARWLIDRYEWDVSEDAVVSALRRHEPSGRLAGQEQLLASADLSAETGLCMATVAAGTATEGRVFQARLPGSAHARLIFEARNEGQVVEALAGDTDEGPPEVQRGIARVTFSFPADAPPSVAAFTILSLLALEEIEVLGQALAGSEVTVFVLESQLSATVAIVENLREDG